MIGSGEGDEAIRYDSKGLIYELIYVLEGEVIYGLDEEQIHLRPGATLYFNSQILHSLKNPGTNSVKLFKVYFMNPIP
ncbi:cupin domain-containing protein [Agaribacillus aureus]|uniref:cupin domain-containing protein n=1 Tax=Agaribacillus aureus TaxID=3051825 RepID=UPI003D1C82D9